MNERFFRVDILSKVGILMKLMKNLSTIVSNLWTRCSIKKIISERSHWCEPTPNPHPSTSLLARLHFDGPFFPPKCERTNWMSPWQIWLIFWTFLASCRYLRMIDFPCPNFQNVVLDALSTCPNNIFNFLIGSMIWIRVFRLLILYFGLLFFHSSG